MQLHKLILMEMLLATTAKSLAETKASQSVGVCGTGLFNYIKQSKAKMLLSTPTWLPHRTVQHMCFPDSLVHRRSQRDTLHLAVPHSSHHPLALKSPQKHSYFQLLFAHKARQLN